MSKVDEISFLKSIEDKAGKYSDSAIMVDCQMFGKKEEEPQGLTAEIRIIPRRGDKKGTVQTLKNLLEKGKVTSDIEILLVNAIEKVIKEKIKSLQVELKDILGIKTEKEITQDGQNNQVMGGDTR